MLIQPPMCWASSGKIAIQIPAVSSALNHLALWPFESILPLLINTKLSGLGWLTSKLKAAEPSLPGLPLGILISMILRLENSDIA